MEPLILLLTYITKISWRAIKVINQVANFDAHSCSETLEACKYPFDKISAVTCIPFSEEFHGN